MRYRQYNSSLLDVIQLYKLLDALPKQQDVIRRHTVLQVVTCVTGTTRPTLPHNTYCYMNMAGLVKLFINSTYLLQIKALHYVQLYTILVILLTVQCFL